MKVGEIVKLSDGLNAAYYTVMEMSDKTATVIWAVPTCDEELKVTWLTPNQHATHKVRLSTMTAPRKMTCYEVKPETLRLAEDAVRRKKLCHLIRTMDFESLSVKQLTQLYTELRKA